MLEKIKNLFAKRKYANCTVCFCYDADYDYMFQQGCDDDIVGKRNIPPHYCIDYNNGIPKGIWKGKTKCPHFWQNDWLIDPDAECKKFFKNNPSDVIWWMDNSDEVVGEWLFSFDKETVFNMFRDYPHELTAEQKAIFDKENPYWADFFKDRQ